MLDWILTKLRCGYCHAHEHVLFCVCEHKYTVLLNMMVEHSWMLGDHEPGDFNGVLKRPNKNDNAFKCGIG